ncbi:MAG: sulfur carrier protein ThiS [Gammaproteobacteria bacterium]
MKLFVNGQSQTVAAGITAAELLAETGFQNKRIAVEINLEIVPRSSLSTLVLKEGDEVEIVQAIGGG